MHEQRPNQHWASALINELVKLGVRRFVVAPGFRSTPLVVAAARHPETRVLVHYDERGAAFCSLGASRPDAPSAVICTSGSAASHCLPAVIEASASQKPLLILSADRPPELLGRGANQTMDQLRLFGAFVRDEVHFPCPGEDIPMDAMLSRLDAAAQLAFHPIPGPVHLNFMFREPLEPEAEVSDSRNARGAVDIRSRAFTRFTIPEARVTEADLEDAAALLRGARHGVLLAGTLNTEAESVAVARLAERMRWPLFDAITAGVRGPTLAAGVIPHYEALLSSERFRRFFAPDCVLHIGGPIISRRLGEHVARSGARQIHLASSPLLLDPFGCLELRLMGNIAAACEGLSNIATPEEERILSAYQRAGAAARQIVEEHLKHDDELDEIRVAAALLGGAAGRPCFVANSMPIRDADAFVGSHQAAYVIANRGVSGIDGHIAFAAGLAWAQKGPVSALLGDMAALHDLNSLALLRNPKICVTLVIVNNNGGRIFERLPIARFPDLLVPYFVAPHECRFEDAAAMYGLAYTRVAGMPELRRALEETATCRSSRVVEAVIDHAVNQSAHEKVVSRIASAANALEYP